jgi:hypothetical protein
VLAKLERFVNVACELFLAKNDRIFLGKEFFMFGKIEAVK